MIVEVKFNVDTNDSEQLRKLNGVLASLGGISTIVPTPAVALVEAVQEAPKAKRAKKVAEAPVEEQSAPVEEQSAPVEEQSAPVANTVTAEDVLDVARATQAPVAEAPKSTVTLQQIKELQTTLVGTHREAIKDKLTEFGAQNASTLPEDKYELYFVFLQTLG